jgi:hypothetical protein
VALLSPKLVGPIASLVGKPIERVAGVTGRLARENTVRQPGRTAVTAAALMIGVALVAFATIFTAGFRDTIDDSIDGGITGQAIIQSQDGFTPFAPSATAAVRENPQVAAVSPLRFADARIQGEDSSVTGVSRRRSARVYDLDVSGLRPDGAWCPRTSPRRRASRRATGSPWAPRGAGARAGDRAGRRHRRHRLRQRARGQRAAGPRTSASTRDSFAFVGLRDAAGADGAVTAPGPWVTSGSRRSRC